MLNAREEHDSLWCAKERFQAGEPVEPGSVREAILESWTRSRAFGVRPGSVDKSLLSPRSLEKRIKARKRFCDVAFPVMDSLFQFTERTGFLLTLTDEEGYVLRCIGDEGIMRQAGKSGLVEGCNRSERRLGTNGIGTPLETGKPIQVFGGEHYYDLHDDWVCSGAPIFRPDGALAGVFCLSGMRESVTYHTLGMVVATAEAITRQYKMQETYDALEAVRKKLSLMIETSQSGVLLLDRAQRVQQANTRAAQLLGMLPDGLVGASLSDVMGPQAPGSGQECVNRSVSVERCGQSLHFSVNVHSTEERGQLVSFEKEETLHKRVNRIIGSEARFALTDIVGRSQALRSATHLAEVAAQNSSSVLLLGESGTGKELFAQAIHNASARRDGPFVAINCGALPKSLIESELFGYEGGSFTGSKREGCAGKFELANGGTIFLDEIGDMPFDVQVSLLRVLQGREVSRIGSSRSTKIDVRVVAATNQNLLSRIEQNLFRRDLYYRLNVFTIKIPPLRERKGDVRLLADYFLRKYASESSGCGAVGFQEAAYQRLEQYPWPGNVRELENAVERAVYLTQSDLVEPESLLLEQVRVPAIFPAGEVTREDFTASEAPAAYAPPAPAGEAFSMKKNEKKQLENALLASGGNVKKAAELLEISRRTMYRKMEKYGIDCGPIRKGE